jgi:hypothetical protein
MTSDWAKNLAARKKIELEQSNRQQEKDLSDRKFLAANSERMWLEVCEAVQKYVAELNSEMGREYITYEGVLGGKSSFILRTSGFGTYSVSFALEMLLLSAQGSTFTLVILAGNGLAWKNSQGAALPSDNVAQVIISSAFR